MVSEIHITEAPGGWERPWPQACELARRLPEGWALVGGLMVSLHAHMAGVEARATVDVDALLDIAVITVPQIDAALRDLGYEFRPSIETTAPAHRWVRTSDDSAIDILVPDHLPQGPRFRRRPTVATPGGSSVLQRHLMRAVVHGAEDTTLLLPTLAGAIVLKSRAYRVDSRDKTRHLEDLAVLFAATEDYLDVVGQMSDSDMRHVRAALRPLFDHLGRTASATDRVRLLLPAIAEELRLHPPLDVSGPSFLDAADRRRRRRLS